MSSKSRGAGILAIVIAAVVGGSACAEISDLADGSVTPPATPQFTPPQEANAPVSNDFDTARNQLDTLAVKGRAPKTGYARDEFGQSWTDDVNVDFGHNGCDTRNDILRRDLTEVTARPGTRDCVILSGVLVDPYSGKTINFVRGEKTSTAVQIDHVVAMSDAWQKGAAHWDEPKRTDFANDPMNLQATDGPTNSRKGAGDAATWLPPSKTYRCTYVARQIDVKARYDIWVTAAEKEAMTQILATC